MFDALHEHDPESKPIYRMIYGRTAAIHAERGPDGLMVELSAAELGGRAGRCGIVTELPDGETMVDPDAATLDAAGAELPDASTSPDMPSRRLRIHQSSPLSTPSSFSPSMAPTRDVHWRRTGLAFRTTSSFTRCSSAIPPSA